MPKIRGIIFCRFAKERLKREQTFKKRLVKKFWQGLKFLAKNFGQELTTLHTRQNKSFRQPLQMSTMTPFRVQVAIGKEALEIAITSPCYI
jgi:hypothetical protein